MQQDEVKTVYEPDFSLKVVSYRDSKTGAIIRRNPYRIHNYQRVNYVEWPVGSGNLWYPPDEESGRKAEHAGRYEKGKIKVGEAHLPWQPELTSDEKLARELATLRQENERINKELAAINREKELSNFASEFEGKQEAAKADNEKKANVKKEGSKK